MKLLIGKPTLREAGEEKVENEQQGDEIHEEMDVPQLSGKCFHEDIADKSVADPLGDAVG
ncbi:MAG: hypothetical protein ACXWMS_02355 [Syntrophales bacterium]